jgi:predicted lipid carrier protein YhbT
MLKFPLRPLAIVLRLLPDALHIEFLSRLFNHLLKGQWMAEQLVDLEGKRLCIAISDTNTELLFWIKDKQLKRTSRSNGDWDVRIKGNLEDFWLLAMRKEDPDTLFFNRQLTIEGETEAGLYLKNLLDAMDFDWETHLQAVLGQRPGLRLSQIIRSTGLNRRLSSGTM